jgi:hypothetical protein
MKSRIGVDFEQLSKAEWAVMIVMIPIFGFVAGIEHVIAKLTGLTYNQVNIIVYYLLIPLSWTVMLDYITMMPFLTPMFIIGWVIFLWKDPMRFRNRCDWAFKKSVDFLLYFKKIGWNYIVSSVIICVVVPVLIYVELIYAIFNTI